MKTIYNAEGLKGNVVALGGNLWNQFVSQAIREMPSEDGLRVAAEVFFEKILPELDNFVTQKLDSTQADAAHFKAEYNRVREERDKAERYFTDTLKERDVALLQVDELVRLCRSALRRCANCGGTGRVKILDYEDDCGICTEDRRRVERLGGDAEKQVGRCPGCDSTAHPGDCEDRA